MNGVALLFTKGNIHSNDNHFVEGLVQRAVPWWAEFSPQIVHFVSHLFILVPKFVKLAFLMINMHFSFYLFAIILLFILAQDFIAGVGCDSSFFFKYFNFYSIMYHVC